MDKTKLSLLKKLAGLACLLLACLLAVLWGRRAVRDAADGQARYRIVNDEYSRVVELTDPINGVTQTLPLEAGETLYGVRLLFATYERVPHGTGHALLLDPAGDGVARADFDMTALLDNTFYGIVFEQPVTPAAAGDYTLLLRFDRATEEDRIGLYASEGAVAGMPLAMANGGALDATAAVQYMTDYTGSLPSTGFLAVGLLLTAAVVGAAALLWLGASPLRLGAFCLAAAGLGLAFCLVTPPLGGPDEYVHLAGSYAMASERLGQHTYDLEGRLLMRACDAPHMSDVTGPADAFVYKRVFSTLAERGCDGALTAAAEVRSPGKVAALLYLPQTAGVLLARVLGLGFTGLVLAGRLCNLAVYIALAAFALWRMPYGKNLLFVTMLLPGCLQLAASFSPDALVLGLAFAFTAHVLAMAAEERALRGWECAVLLALAAALGPAKAVYVLLVGLVLLIPARRFAKPLYGLGLKAGAFAAAALGWLVYNLEYIRYILRDVNEMTMLVLVLALAAAAVAARPLLRRWLALPRRTRLAVLCAGGAAALVLAVAALMALRIGGALTPEQLAAGIQPNGDSIYTWSVGYTLRHLPGMVKLLVATLCAKLPQLVQEVLGMRPGEPIVYGLELSWAITVALLGLVLVAACRPAERAPRLGLAHRWAMALILLGVSGLLVFACLTWTPVNYEILFGLQGRYFLPVLPLALLLWGENDWLRLGRDLTRPVCLAAAALPALALLQAMCLYAAH